MMRAAFVSLTVAMFSFLFSPTLTAQERKKEGDTTAKNDEQAKEIAVRFMKAIKEKDIEGAMKLADVPWYSERGLKPHIVKDRDDVRSEVRKTIDDFKLHPDRVPTDV